MTDLLTPRPYLEVVVTVYERGTLEDGRRLLDIRHDAMSFSDNRASDPAFLRHILTLVASSLPPSMPDNVQRVSAPPPLLPTQQEDAVPL